MTNEENEGRLNLEDVGALDGHHAGMKDALDGRPQNPQPSLVAALADQAYLNAFRKSYAEAHAQGRDMRETLVGWRANVDAIEKAAEKAGHENGEGREADHNNR